MIFDNFNSFIQMAGAKALVAPMDIPEEDMVDVISLLKRLHGYEEAEPETQEYIEDANETDTETEDEPALFALKYGTYVNRAGDPVVLNLSDYDIDIIDSDGECYIPFQTMNDLLENETNILDQIKRSRQKAAPLLNKGLS